MTTPDEVRVVNARTGAEKGRKLARFGLIPVRALRMLAEQFGHGAAKYTDRNWEKGFKWSLSYDALQRHLGAFWGGEWLDEEGRPHLAAALFHVCVLIEYHYTHPELDDRTLDSPGYEE